MVNWSGVRVFSRGTIVSFLVVILSLVGLEAARAQASFPSTITINYDGTNFTGTVGSTSPSCVSGRTVTVFREEGATDAVVGSAFTNSAGNYTVSAPGANGQFYATVSTTTIGTYGGSFTCQGATSNTITVGPTPTPTVTPTEKPLVPTTVSIGHDGENFFGTVASEDAQCSAGRSVEIVNAATGEVVATTNAMADGQYSVAAPNIEGDFFARVVEFEPTPGTVRCGADDSDVIRVREDRIPGPCASIPSAFVGTSGDDVIVGTSGDDVICGLGGDDTIAGRPGNDLILGGPGNDSIRGGSGADTLRGGGGADAINGGDGKDILRGGGGNDTLKGNKSHDTLRGGGGNDELRGGRGRDTLNGGSGTDSCRDRFGDNIFRNCEMVRR